MPEFAPQLAANNGWKRQRLGSLQLALASMAVLGLLAALLASLFWIPRWVYPDLTDAALRGVTDPGRRQELKDDRKTLQNGARTSSVQGVSALLVLTGAGLGAWAALRQVRATRDQLAETARANQETARANREQLALSEQGQLTDRYTSAVDQLGSKELEVRIGGIFALERIARESRNDRARIYAVLSAFVRARSPWPPSLPGQYVADARSHQVPELLTRAADVQAAMTVLAYRSPVPIGDEWPGQEFVIPLDLSHSDLRGARLPGADLHGAWLHQAHLQNGMLLEANLQEAQLILADLRDAALVGARLQGADLTRADLRGADLREAKLQGAVLFETKADARTHWPDGWNREQRIRAGVTLVQGEEAPYPRDVRPTANS